MKDDDFKMLADLAGFNTAKFDEPQANLLRTRLRTFANLVENHVLGGYPDKDGNRDISIMGQGIAKLESQEQVSYSGNGTAGRENTIAPTGFFFQMPKESQEPVAHSVISGALFDFMGWLTSRKERIVLSSADNASPAVEAITEFARMRNLSLDDAKVQDWHTHPPQRTEQEQPLPPVEIGVDVTADGASVVAFYRRPNAVMEMFYSQFHPAPQRTEQEPVALPCCGYRDASAVKWNPLNAVVQCHNCGQTYTPPSQRKPLTDEECDDLWDMQVIHITDRVSAKQFIRDIEAAHGIKGDV